MKTHYAVVIVGGGQAGLAMSYCLKEKGIDHLVLEKHQVGHEWRTNRWDSFCLVTPNWQCQLPGYPYAGSDPQGFMQKDEIVQYLEGYRALFNPPVQEGVTVTDLRPSADGTPGFQLTTSLGDFRADQVVIATGGYHQPNIPRLAERLPEHIVQLHSLDYKTPDALSNKAVLVIGTGQSGCQIAEDLHLSGKQVHLCVGGAPRSPRRYRGKDVVDWLDQMGYYDLSIDEHPQKEKARTNTNHYVTGRDGGREIDLRRFALEGMKLYGRLSAIRGQCLYLADDLKHNLDHADTVAENIKQTIDRFISANQIEAPTEPPYQPVWQPTESIEQLDFNAANIGTVIWCTGFAYNYRWVQAPVFDGKGYPVHERGVSPWRGLYFLGLPWLHTWGSGRFSGVARDAQYLADYIVAIERKTHVHDWSVMDQFLLGS
jgi:putative flavoprotein involved in K+ transport